MISKPLFIAFSVYLTAIFMSNLLGLKTMPFFFGTHISFAVFTLPFVFVTTDIVGKIYGKDTAKQFVFLGFFSLLLWTFFSWVADVLPWSSQSFARIWVHYDVIFSLSLRIAWASLIAFLISEYLDVLVFFQFKNQKKSFWIASFLSNMVSQFIDTWIFMLIAFYGIFNLHEISTMALPWWIYKVSMSVMYMPISYIILHILSKYESKI